MWYFPVKENVEHLTDAGTHVSCDEGTLTIDRYRTDKGPLQSTDSGIGEGNTFTHSKAQLHFQLYRFNMMQSHNARI